MAASQYTTGVDVYCDTYTLMPQYTSMSPVVPRYAVRTAGPRRTYRARRTYSRAKLPCASGTYGTCSCWYVRVTCQLSMSPSLMTPTHATTAPTTYCRKRLAIALKLLSRIGAKLELDIAQLRFVTVCFWIAWQARQVDGGLCNSWGGRQRADRPRARTLNDVW